MPRRVFARDWAELPQSPVPGNPGTLLGSAPGFLWVGTAPHLNMLNGRPFTTGAVLARAASRLGIGVRGSGTNLIGFPTTGLPASTSYTVAAYILDDAGRGVTRNPFDCDDTASGRVFQLRLTAGNAPEFIPFTNGSNFATGTAKPAGPAVLAGRVQGTTCSGWWNGRQDAQSTLVGSPTQQITTGTRLAVGNIASAGSNAFQGQILLCRYWPFALTDAQMAMLTPANIAAALLAPQRVSMGAAVTGIYRPGSDITTNGWAATPTGPLWDAINEPAASDADFITSPNLATPTTMGLSPPLPAGTYLVNVRADRSQTQGQLRVRFLDNSSADVGGTAWQALTSSASTYTMAATTTATADRFRIEVQP